MAKTGTGKSIQKYIKDVLGQSSKAGKAAIKAGYPADSKYTQAYMAGVPYLYQYGDPTLGKAVQNIGDVYKGYGEAGGYNKTAFGDIEAKYGQAGQYDPTQYEMADYTTKNIMERMTPYEELVSGRAKARLEKAYKEGRGEREAQAARAGAFGGSGAAIQEELARRNYLEQMADMDAQNLQSAYEAAVGLYGKETADRLAAQQATEASRQFSKQTEMSGIEGIMAARQQAAAQEAAAKEAQLAALQGQGTAAQAQANMAQQEKNFQLANLAAMQQAGQQAEGTQLARQEYGLDISGKQANLLAPLAGGAIQQKENKPGIAQTIFGTAAGIAGLASGFGLGKASGGLVYANGGLAYLTRGMTQYNGGGLAELEPEYYSGYEY